MKIKFLEIRSIMDTFYRICIFCIFLFLTATSAAQQPIEWNFNTQDDKEDWNIIDGSYNVENGCMYFNPSTRTSKLTKGVSFDASEYKYLTVRLKNADVNGVATVSYRSSSSPYVSTYNAPFVFDITIRDQTFKEYTIDLQNEPYWKGTIYGLMIELPAHPSIGANVIIDYIKMSPLGYNTNSNITSEVNALDSITLVNFYNSFNGILWNNKTNWLTTSKLANWYGVNVSYSNYDWRVARISLQNNNLKTSSVCLSDLTGLKYLNLDGNNLSDVSFLYDLSGIDTLSVKNNNLCTTQLIALKQCVSASKSSYQYIPQNSFILQKIGSGISAINAGNEPDNIYSWYDANNTMVYEVIGDPLYSPSVIGNYYVKVSNPRLPGLILTSQNFYTDITSTFKNVINIYPNPATDYFSIENATNMQISMYSLSGQLILQKQIVSRLDKISLNMVQSGIYQLTVEDHTNQDKIVTNYKIIVY